VWWWAVPYWLEELFNKFIINKDAFPFPVLDPVDARKQFRFPVNHPVDGVAYACSETEPDLYVPLARFHQYMYEAKLAAFHNLCANLGARRCIVVYAEEDGKDITFNIGVSGIPTQTGTISGNVGAGFSQRKSESAKVFAEYPKPNRPITGSQSGWMNGEPTWVMMQKERLERNLLKYQAEFTYLDDMGINADLAANIAGFGINIGGKFEEMHRRKWIFDVEFWPL